MAGIDFGNRVKVEEGKVKARENGLLNGGTWSNTLLIEEVTMVPGSC